MFVGIKQRSCQLLSSLQLPGKNRTKTDHWALHPRAAGTGTEGTLPEGGTVPALQGIVSLLRGGSARGCPGHSHNQQRCPGSVPAWDGDGDTRSDPLVPPCPLWGLWGCPRVVSSDSSCLSPVPGRGQMELSLKFPLCCRCQWAPATKPPVSSTVGLEMGNPMDVQLAAAVGSPTMSNTACVCPAGFEMEGQKGRKPHRLP